VALNLSGVGATGPNT